LPCLAGVLVFSSSLLLYELPQAGHLCIIWSGSFDRNIGKISSA
jgi:hypothetical protein